MNRGFSLIERLACQPKPWRRQIRSAFSLIELLVVIAVLALLAGLAVPPALSAIERARVARVVSDLRTVEVALEAYRIDFGSYPPVTVSCMAIDADQVLQLPQELADGGYLPKNNRTQTSTLLEDPFYPGNTYKYAAPERYWMNGSMQNSRYAVWVPSDFPSCQSDSGKADDSARSPLAWAVWSQGPRPDKAKALSNKAPTAGFTWYRSIGENGAIGRYKERDGATWSTLRPMP